MKKIQKLKGFTLVELIVVIAIIAILAAVLVPGLIGYLSDARISTANTNAATFDKACQSALTKAATAGETLTGDNLYASDGTDVILSLDGSTGTINITFGTFNINLADYLGTKFEGVGMCNFNGNTYSTIACLWAADEAALGSPAPATVDVPNTGEQAAAAKSTGVVGYFPAPEAGTVAANP